MASMKLVNVKLANLKMDLGRNPRLPSAYDKKDKDFVKLIESIEIDGFRLDKPITVSKRSDASEWVVQGHRRVHAARDINSRKPDMLVEIPAIVHTGLSLDDERRMLIDQFLVKKLDVYGQYLSVKQLMYDRNMSEEKIARHIGMSRGWVQRRMWVAKMPADVENEWKKMVEGEEGYLPLTDKVLNRLHKAYQDDKEIGRHDEEGGGPAFKEAWTSVKNRDLMPADPKAMTRDQMLDKAGIFRDKIISTIIKYCAGDPVVIQEVQEQLELLYAKAANWDNSQKTGEGEAKQA